MRYGMVALTVLYVPRTSISMTVLNPLDERPEIGLTKFPAAPALRRSQYKESSMILIRLLHDKVDGTKFFHTPFGGLDQVIGLFHY